MGVKRYNIKIRARLLVAHLLTTYSEAYLAGMYELLREDAVRPLREAVNQVKDKPTADEEEFSGTIGIYEKVTML